MTAKCAIIGQRENDDIVQYWFDFNYLGLVGQKPTDNGQFNSFPILDSEQVEPMIRANNAIIGQREKDEPGEYWLDYNCLGLEGQQKIQTCNTFPI